MTPTLAITFDTELIWGSVDHVTPAEFERRYPDVRGAIAGIMRLLQTYEISATWAVVGHLFLARCREDASGSAHPAIVMPARGSAAERWFRADPCTSRERDPLFYGDDLLDLLTASRTAQEIGCHSFVHAPYDDPAMTAEVVRSDLAECKRAAARRGIELTSFVFPRNREAHHDSLRAEGFTAYRGADPTWHASIGGPAGRLAHLIDQGMAIPPPVSTPRQILPGLWNIPGSMLLLHNSGFRGAVPLRARVAKAKAGLRRAVREGAVFHLWTHPFNVASDAPFMLEALERILREAALMRDREELLVEPMRSIAKRSRQEGIRAT
jgi:peptidoglycan/xylan/chitin deacetylase (PgdA/CDA1 family)